MLATDHDIPKSQSDFLPVDLPAIIPEPALICDSNYNILALNSGLSLFLGYLPNADQDDFELTQIESLCGINFRDNIESGSMHCFSNLQGDLKHFRLHYTQLRSRQTEYKLYVLEDCSEYSRMTERLERKRSELSVFSQVVSVLGSTLSFNEILKVILIAVTAREGLGLNRAFLFLNDTETVNLQGYLAVGPSSPEEAGKIWNSLPNENKSLIEILRQYTTTLKTMDSELNRRIQQVSIPLEHENNILREVVESGQPRIITAGQCECDGQCKICQLFNVSEFAVVPIRSGNRVLGVITADNCITSRPISQNSLGQLQVFAHQAAIAIERTRLYERLSANVQELERTNAQLKKAQDDLLKLERVSLWSELTYDIAHDLRNPASIIGGFAGLIRRSEDLPESLTEQAEIIYSECGRLEKALNDLLDFSKSFSQDNTDFCLRQLIEEVIELINTKSPVHEYIIDSGLDINTIVSAKRDQLKFVVYSIIMLFEESVSTHNSVKIRLCPADNSIKVRFEVCCDEDSAVKLMTDFGNPRAGKLGLKVSMAFEAVKFNGGSLGIEASDSRKPCLYLECPYGGN